MTEVVNILSKVSEIVQIGDITPANLQQLRVLNFSTLPVRYSDKFYNELLSIYSGEFMKFAFCNGFVCGGICARIENSPDNSNRKRLYIMTLNVFAAYRRRGIGIFLFFDDIDEYLFILNRFLCSIVFIRFCSFESCRKFGY